MTLDGTKVLLVEDEGMIAMLLKSMLASIGCNVVGTAARVPDAINKVGTLSFDVALLDLNLAGTLSYPVADALRLRGMKFIFVTSYGRASLPPEMHDTPMLSKPFVVGQLEQALAALRDTPPSPSSPTP